MEVLPSKNDIYGFRYLNTIEKNNTTEKNNHS